MKEQIIQYIVDEFAKLKRGQATTIDLVNVSPKIIEEATGLSLIIEEQNGWQGDYWGKIEDYEVSGCMYDGTASISIPEE